MTLSEQRMHSVANFLDGLKLKVSSMFAKGETSPVLDDNGEDLGKSRRVYVAIKTRQLKD
jgi:outer membrane protein OmpA-like peptidoglycan-associated protein